MPFHRLLRPLALLWAKNGGIAPIISLSLSPSVSIRSVATPIKLVVWGRAAVSSTTTSRVAAWAEPPAKIEFTGILAVVVRTILWYSSQKLSTKFGEVVITTFKGALPHLQNEVRGTRISRTPPHDARGCGRVFVVIVTLNVTSGRRVKTRLVGVDSLHCTMISLSLQEFKLTSSVTPSLMRCVCVCSTCRG